MQPVSSEMSSAPTSPLPHVSACTSASVARRQAVFCAPDTTTAEAAELMTREHDSAVLVTARDGLGIVTDADLCGRVVALGVSSDAPVSAIMSRPLHVVDAGASVQEAGLIMLETGADHLPVVDAEGGVMGMLSESSVVGMDAFGLFALRRAILTAHSADELAEIATPVPRLYMDLVDAGLEASTLSRIVSTLCDAMTSRLLESSVERRGAPPVPYAWLALGSTGRNELALASDQDNALAFADTDDPLADVYFLQMATDVVEGLHRCGFPPDAHGVLATHREWRMQRSAWLRAFADCLNGADNERLLRAAIGFDFRHVAGDLSIVPELNEVIRQAPRHSRFLGGLAELGSEISSPLGFRRRLKAPVDIKKDGLLPVQNLARYYAFAGGITATNTADRLAAVHQAGGTGSDAARSLRDAFLSMTQLQARHHANGVRAGRVPDNRIDTPRLRPLTKASLQEGLRVVAAVQEQLPRRAVL